jgi:flagellin-like hook-associated protein FlgL
MYGAGYVAAMYLGHLVGAGNTGAGLDRVLADLAAGASLDQIIAQRTPFSGLADFQNHLRNPGDDVFNFVRNLITSTANGSGSVLGNLNQSMSAILAGQGTSEDFLRVNAYHSVMRNTYPDGYNVVAGGGATISGTPIHPDVPTPGDMTIPPGQPIPQNIRPGSGGSSGTLILQVGANAGDIMEVHIRSMSSASLGLTGVNVATQDESSDAMEFLTTAINIVSMERAQLGAYQNRLEFKIHNVDNSSENLAASESRIRDVDMAKAMTDFTRNNILFQASTAMLAQANSLPYGVLGLLA